MWASALLLVREVEPGAPSYLRGYQASCVVRGGILDDSLFLGWFFHDFCVCGESRASEPRVTHRQGRGSPCLTHLMSCAASLPLGLHLPRPALRYQAAVNDKRSLEWQWTPG